MLQFQGIPAVPWIHKIHHITSSPHYPQSNGFAEALVGISKKLMEKSIKDGKPWNYGPLQYRVTPILSTIPSPLEALTGRKLRTLLSQTPSSIGKSVENSRIHQELMKHQPASTFTRCMELEPGQPVFMKEVHGHVWRTGTIHQPAKEPDSYWIKFPDSSIMRRIQSMIKPRSLPSHFKLETESKERNNSEFIPSSASSNFQSMFPGPEHPALPTGNLVTPQLSEKGTPPMRKDIPATSPGITHLPFHLQLCWEDQPMQQNVFHQEVSLHPRNKHWNFVEVSGRSFWTYISNWLFHSIQLTVWWSMDTHIV